MWYNKCTFGYVRAFPLQFGEMMVDNKTTIVLELNDGGTIKAATTNAKQLNAAGKEITSTFAQAGKTMKAARARSEPMSDREEYNIARSGIGTGAAGRDFAKQSQGLGGLVRLYATFAANIFAVSAAFSALSRAADTTNMVEGLNQLGAQSGRSLGSVAKNIVKVTDGAVSLREAMTATAQASAAGMSAENITRVAKAARGASLALGVDMGDALSRLSRGITKLEPELLDELGIFVRVDKAAQEYARSLGKSALSLTDVEKRAAFAEATLSQAEKKFGKLDIPANPYTQLLASLKDVTQQGLELINKVIGPIAKLLAASPAALAAAIGLIGTLLLKQAIPAVGAFRANMKAMAEETRAAAAEQAELFKNFQEGAARQLANNYSPKLKAQIIDLGAAAVKVQQDLDKSSKEGGRGSQLLKRVGLNASSADLAAAEKSAKWHEDKAAKQINGVYKLTQAERDQNLAKAAYLRSDIEAVRKYQELEKQTLDLKKQENTVLEKKGHLLDNANMQARINERLQRSAIKSTIVANAADNASFIGPKDAWTQMSTAIQKNEAGLGRIGKTALYARGAFAIATTAVSTAVSAFGIWGVAIGLVGAGFAYLSGKMASNAKQVEETSEAMKTAEESTANLTRTMAVFKDLDPFDKFTPEAIQARANALDGLGASAVSMVTKLKAEISSRGTWDKVLNFFSSSEADVGKQLAEQLSKAIEVARNSPELRGKVNSLLSISGGTADPKAIKNYLGSNVALQESAAKELNDFGKTSSKTAAIVTEANNSLKAAVKTQQELIASMSSRDPMAKFGNDLMKNALDLALSLKEPNTQLANMLALVIDVNKLALFPSETAVNLARFKTELEDINKEILNNVTAIAKLEQELDKLNSSEIKAAVDFNKQRLAESPNASGSTVDLMRKVVSDYENAQNRIQNGIASLTAAQTKNYDRLTVINKEFGKGALASLIEGAKHVDNAIAQGFQKAAIKTQSIVANALGDTKAGIVERARLEQASINSQLSIINSEINLVKSLDLLRYTLMENALKERDDKLAASNFILDPILKRNADNERIKIAEELNLINLQKNAVATGSNKSLLKSVSSDSAGFSPELIASIQATAKTVQTIQSLSSKAAELKAESLNVNFNKELLVSRKEYEEKQKKAFEPKELKVEEDEGQLNIKKQIGALTQQEILKEEYRIGIVKQNLLLSKQQFEYMVKDAELNSMINFAKQTGNIAGAKAAADTKTALGEEYDRTSDIVIKRNALNNSIKQTAIELSIIETKFKKDQDKKTNDLGIATTEKEKQSIDVEGARKALDILNEQGKIGTNEYNTRVMLLEKEQLRIEYLKEQLSIQASMAAVQDKLANEISKASMNGPIAPERYQELVNAANYETAVLERRNSVLDYGYQSKVKYLELANTQTEEMKAFDRHFEDSVGRMSDALVEFAFTGKQNFSEMVRSMIKDLVMLETKMIIVNALKNAGGFSGIIGKIVGGITGAGPTANPAVAGHFGSMVTSAKGNVFGAERFAKGDTFTNRVVNSPTVFKFAKGAKTGVMGEAGPEAIMPLKRDASGNLGVRSESSNQQPLIITNNFTINGPTDRRTQQQIAAASLAGAQRALSRNG